MGGRQWLKIASILFGAPISLSVLVWLWYGRQPDVPFLLIFALLKNAYKNAAAEDHSRMSFEFVPRGGIWKPRIMVWFSKIGDWLVRLGVIRDWNLSAESLERTAFLFLPKDNDPDPLDEIEFPFRSNMRTLLASIAKENRLSFWGKMWLKYDFVGRLRNRIFIRREIRRHPEILQEKIEAPIVIMGAFRTGTTLFQSLLAQDSSMRTLKAFEALNAGQTPEAARSATDLSLTALFWSSPALRAAHYMQTEDNEECHIIHRLMFCTLLDSHFGSHVPGYREAHKKMALDPVYQYQRRVLQLLQWRRRQSSREPAPRWVLKCPDHMLAVSCLLRTFPDAICIWTHRDPVNVLSSMASLAGLLHSVVSDKVELEDVATPLQELLEAMFRKGMEDRQEAERSSPPTRFIDIHFHDLVQDTAATLDRLYSELGIPRTPATHDQQMQFLARNPRHKHGNHVHSWQKFGYDKSALLKTFQSYITRFGVKLE